MGEKSIKESASDSAENKTYNWCWLGFHDWNKWRRPFSSSIYQERTCKLCGYVKEKLI